MDRRRRCRARPTFRATFRSRRRTAPQQRQTRRLRERFAAGDGHVVCVERRNRSSTAAQADHFAAAERIRGVAVLTAQRTTGEPHENRWQPDGARFTLQRVKDLGDAKSVGASVAMVTIGDPLAGGRRLVQFRGVRLREFRAPACRDTAIERGSDIRAPSPVAEPVVDDAELVHRVADLRVCLILIDDLRERLARLFERRFRQRQIQLAEPVVRVAGVFALRDTSPAAD